MDVELIKALSDFSEILKDYRTRVIPTEQEFTEKLRVVVARLNKEVEKLRASDVENR